MKDLIEILTYCRGAGTTSESEFVRDHICTIDGIKADGYSNYHLTIGDNPKILWSGHTDTVTRKVGRQNVKWLGKGILGLHNPQQGQCLGADDGAGLWIMFELIKNKRPGHYVFHREEEIGGLGSSWLSKDENFKKYIPSSVQCAIAMDRCGTQDIITHQMCQRTASDKFADSLMLQLPNGMRKDDGGVFTDTANYIDLIGECTNLACGYERNHGPSETLDTVHLRQLRDALVELDENKLEFSCQAGDVEYGDFYGYGHGTNHMTYPSRSSSTSTVFNDEDWEEWERQFPYAGDSTREAPLDVEQLDGSVGMTDLVTECPAVAGKLLEELGVTKDEFRAHVYALTGRLIGA